MKLRAVVALIIAALVGAGGTLAVQALFFNDEESIPEAQRLGQSWLEGVDPNELNVYLSPPPSQYRPEVTSRRAKRAAGAQYEDVTARQIVLAHLQTEAWGGFDGQVWIVNFDPADPDLHAFCPSASPIYALAFVDADTGELLGVMGAGRPSPSCGPAPRVTETPAP
jgi:hypothetical protein